MKGCSCSPTLLLLLSSSTGPLTRPLYARLFEAWAIWVPVQVATTMDMTQLRPGSEQREPPHRIANGFQGQDPSKRPHGLDSTLDLGILGAGCRHILLSTNLTPRRAIKVLTLTSCLTRDATTLGPSCKKPSRVFPIFRRHHTVSAAITCGILERSKNMRACERHCPTWGTPQLPMTQFPTDVNSQALALEQIDGLN